MLNSKVMKEVDKFCAHYGSDHDMVQGQGGNFSVKGEGTMSIKASGLRLEEALEKNIFVTCDLSKIQAAYSVSDEAAIKTSVVDKSELRPSIETSLHSVLPGRFVFHFHSVNAIALTAQPVFDDRLNAMSKELQAPIVPYAKPGIALAQAVEAKGVEHHSFILRHHGALVQAPDLEKLKERVELFRDHAQDAASLTKILRKFTPQGNGWLQNSDEDVIFLGKMAHQHPNFKDSNLYPDHPVILGPGITTTRGNQQFWYVNENGLFIQDNDKAMSALPMIECLVRVTKRLDFSSPVFEGLNSEQVNGLLNWEAEKYRKKLTAK